MSKFDSIHLNMQPNVANYDLYLPSNLRQNCIVNIPIEVGKFSININAFKMLYATDKDKYNQLIEKFSNIDSRMLFIGFSNSSAVFIEGGEQFLKFSNDNLKMHHACPDNSSVKRIIIKAIKRLISFYELKVNYRNYYFTRNFFVFLF